VRRGEQGDGPALTIRAATGGGSSSACITVQPIETMVALEKTYPRLRARWGEPMTRIARLGAATAFVVMSFLTCAAAQDSVRGQMLAQQQCARCHNINDGARRTANAPTFGEIARRINFEASQLAIYMAFGHIPMGNGRVSVDEAGDLAAYIVTLRRR